MSVEVRDNPDEHRYEAWLDGELAGYATYRASEQVVTIRHTEVPEEFAGHGIGGKLARGTLDDLRARGLRVRPVCPFFAGWIGKHPDYEDMVEG